MRFTDDHYGHTNDPCAGDVRRIYLTDDTGAVWCICPAEGGLRISPVAPLRREAVFSKPVASNVLIVQARDHEDNPKC